MSQTNFQELLDAGVHFGHLKRKWNPAMAPYIFMERNGILFDNTGKLEKTDDYTFILTSSEYMLVIYSLIEKERTRQHRSGFHWH